MISYLDDEILKIKTESTEKPMEKILEHSFIERINNIIDKTRPLVVIETPFKGHGQKGIEYAQKALKDSLLRGEYPFASHLLYTQVLDDKNPEERNLGIEAGLTWCKNADLTAVYIDLGISEGMIEGILDAQKEGRKIEFRTLYQ